MGKNAYGDISNPDFSSPHTQGILNKLLVDNDLTVLKQVLGTLSSKYNLSPDEIAKLATSKEEITIPVSIYGNDELSTLESTVKYLKEELNLTFSKIGYLLNRSEKTIWATYHNANNKSKLKLDIRQTYSVPINILSNRAYSILEQLVGFLKENYGLRFSQIAKLLCLNDRTVWTCYHRLKKKREGENEAK